MGEMNFHIRDTKKSCALSPLMVPFLSWPNIYPIVSNIRKLVQTYKQAELLSEDEESQLLAIHAIGFLNFGAYTIGHAYHVGIGFEHPTQLR